MNLHDTWTALRHGGNLLTPEALEALPDPGHEPPDVSLLLRSALTALEPGALRGEALTRLLDVVLRDVLGLRVGWRAGNNLGAADTERLLDGTPLKPRRLWEGRHEERLPVFTTDAHRVGVGRGRRPVAQVLEYLRRRSLPLGLLTNGREWRLIWADIDAFAWAEWDLDRFLHADQLSDELTVLRRILSFSSLSRRDTGEAPLLTAIRGTRRGQGKLSKELGERVRRAVETLLRCRQPVLTAAWDEHTGADLYVAASHFVMRLVVILFAEARELLPVDNPVYHQAYGLRGLLEQLDRLTTERRKARRMGWPRLLALFRLLHQGSPHPALLVPTYGGDLFKSGNRSGDGVQRALALLEAIQDAPDDDALYRLLVLLTRTTQRVKEGATWRNVAAPVDFTELTSEYIGILYEGLLDYELHRAGEHPVLFLNLGDQPALPLDRLEALDDDALAALVEKAKVKKRAESSEVDESDADEDDDSEDDAAEGAEDGDTDADDEEHAAGAALGEGDDEEETGPEDLRAIARARAIAWGRRAATAGGLVTRPKGRGAEDNPVYQGQLDSAATQLIADLKLPGELYLVRWGGTRKGAGTFYTRPQLTLPTARRTLEPLIYTEEGHVRQPEQLLALKVCDPAMGSGSFLVAALRVLTDAVVRSLHQHRRIMAVNGRTTITCALLPEADRSLPTEGFEERLEALVRRAVVEHCLYGVDLDPLAVELARVALWVETLDRRLPFTFLDHKLRPGNSLVGTWLDHFRDYPLLAFDRQSPDRHWKGVHHPADVWHDRLKGVRDHAIKAQVDLLTGQLSSVVPQTSDEELKQAVERVRRLYRELRAVPSGRPDERARIWRERIVADPALEKVRLAFDTWCALWFWPLDRLELLPLPGQLAAPSDDALAVVRDVRDKERFFHWELEFPDVFTGEGTGFDAVVGNPPWEIQKPSSKEFFSNLDPLYRAYGKQEALKVQRALFRARAELEDDWLDYMGSFKDRGNFVRNAAEPFGDGKVADHDGGSVSLVRGKENVRLHRLWRTRRSRSKAASDARHPFRHQGSADLNTYKMFVELGHAVLREGGQLGMIVPSGLYTDKGTGALRKLLLKACRWRWLYGFENRDQIFDIHRSFKFCINIAEKGGVTEVIQAAFMRHDLEDWADAKGVLDYPAARVQEFSPKSLSVLEVRTQSDLALLAKLYTNGVLLGSRDENGWGIEYATEFHMTNDSKLFIPRNLAESRGFVPDIYGRWIDPNGEMLLPLYEGRMIGQMDFSEKGWVSGKGRTAVWREIPWEEKRLEPQFLMRTEDLPKMADGYGKSGKVGFMDVTSSTNRRTMISAVVPPYPCGNKVPLLCGSGVPSLLVGVLGSFCFDWHLRQRLGGMTLNYFIVQETVLPIIKRLIPCVPRLCTSLVAAGLPMATSWGSYGATAGSIAWRRLWAITPHERLRLRCMLDAIVAVLYGLDRDDFSWILKDCDHPRERLSDKAFCRRLDPKGFWRVDKTELPELRHTVLSLAAFDALQAQIATAGHDREAGIEAFCAQNEGDGWMLPEALCLADLGLTRTVDEGCYDERAKRPQPVRSQLGPRFLDWQLSQTPEESWAECERHAKAILEGMPGPVVEAPKGDETKKVAEEKQLGLFGG